MKTKLTCLLLLSSIFLLLCSCENYSNGERIGMVTQFSKSGAVFKSWEGHLNATQTGMNSSVPFDFSVDNDNEPDGIVKTLDSAAQFGWKVKLVYHETAWKNLFSNRGHTDNFVTKCEVLDKTPMQSVFGQHPDSMHATGGHVIDTIYVVMIPDTNKYKIVPK